MLEAKDIMTEEVLSVKKDTPIYKAMEIMVKYNISGIPVAEDDMTLLGVLSDKDVLQLFYSKKDEEDKTVGDFMTQPVVHFNENESLLDICDCLMNNPFRRVPVISKGKLVGIVSRRDLIKYILQLKDESNKAD